MNKQMKKLADLSTYLDKRGHREESHQLDHALHALSQESPDWWSPANHVSSKPVIAQVPGEDKPVDVADVQPHIKQNFVVLEAPGIEPIKVSKVSEVIQLVGSPKVPDEAIIQSIYNSIHPGGGDAMLEPAKNVTAKDAIESGVKAGVLEDDRRFWQR